MGGVVSFLSEYARGYIKKERTSKRDPFVERKTGLKPATLSLEG